MRKILIFAGIATLIFGVFIIDRFRVPDYEPPRAIDLPETLDFSKNDITGKRIALSDYKNQPVILKFFATWCGSCNAMTPDVIALHKNYPDIKIIGLSLDEDPELVRDYQAKQAIPYPLVMLDEALNKQYSDIRVIPTLLFLDRDHQLVDYTTGYQNYDDLKDLIQPLL